MLQNKKRKERQILGQSRFLGRSKKSRGSAACTYEKIIIIIIIITAGACYAGFLLQGYPDYRFLGVLAPYKALFGEAPPERGTFVKLHAYEKAGIS